MVHENQVQQTRSFISPFHAMPWPLLRSSLSFALRFLSLKEKKKAALPTFQTILKKEIERRSYGTVLFFPDPPVLVCE